MGPFIQHLNKKYILCVCGVMCGVMSVYGVMYVCRHGCSRDQHHCQQSVLPILCRLVYITDLSFLSSVGIAES
jgi:hypothetical protein